jgi:hypothetical protein
MGCNTSSARLSSVLSKCVESLSASQSRKFKAEVIETNAGHFLQEQVPEVLSEAILQVISEQRQK